MGPAASCLWVDAVAKVVAHHWRPRCLEPKRACNLPVQRMNTEPSLLAIDPDPGYAAQLALLRLLEQRPDHSQRELAFELGVSLGKTHYLLKASVSKGWVKTGIFSLAAFGCRPTRAFMPIESCKERVHEP